MLQAPHRKPAAYTFKSFLWSASILSRGGVQTHIDLFIHKAKYDSVVFSFTTVYPTFFVLYLLLIYLLPSPPSYPFSSISLTLPLSPFLSPHSLFPSLSLTVINCLLGWVIHLAISQTWTHTLSLLPCFPLFLLLFPIHPFFPPVSFHPKVSEAHWGGTEGKDLPDNSRLYVCAHALGNRWTACAQKAQTQIYKLSQGFSCQKGNMSTMNYYRIWFYNYRTWSYLFSNGKISCKK